jgi:hypothetical protein
MITDPDKIPDQLREALRTYAAVQMEILEDTNVKAARTRLTNAMAIYEERVKTAADYIKAHVLELEESVSIYGVTVNHRKEHPKVSWISAELNELFKENEDLLGSARKTTIVKPSVSLKFTPVEEK